MSVCLSPLWALQKPLTNQDAFCVVDSGWPKKACVRWGAHWRHLANKVELSVCGDNAAFCQITLITCYVLDAGRHHSCVKKGLRLWVIFFGWGQCFEIRPVLWHCWLSDRKGIVPIHVTVPVVPEVLFSNKRWGFGLGKFSAVATNYMHMHMCR